MRQLAKLLGMHNQVSKLPNNIVSWRVVLRCWVTCRHGTAWSVVSGAASTLDCVLQQT